MHVVVLGAGVVGVTGAWYLAKAGHRVTVVERRDQAALETSYANGGQVSISHAEPWANPGAPATLLKWLGREDAPLLFRLRADRQQWLWGARFLLECLPWRTDRNARAIAALARLSGANLKTLRAETGIAYDSLSRGILHIYTTPREWAVARTKLPALRAMGLQVEEKSADQCRVLEPALAEGRTPLAGGIHCPDDESGDARKFTQALAVLARSAGVTFRFDTQVQGLETMDGRVTGVRVTGPGAHPERIDAEAFVVSLGSYSPGLLRPLHENLPIYPVKGYSVTLPVGPQHVAPTVSLTDEAYKLVFSRLGDRLRVAGTAELTGYDTGINLRRCEAILERVFRLFPRAGDRERVELWAGLRPATPGNVPVIGRSRRHANLYLNTGHGTLGWTLSCGSAQVLTDLMAGRPPQIGFPLWGGD